MKKFFTLFFVALLSISLANAATVTLTMNVSASPEEGGLVSLDGDSYKASANEVFAGESTLSWFTYSTVSHDFSLYAQTNEDYVFKGFATSASANSGNTANPYTVTMSKQGGLGGTSATSSYFAIFAKMKADSEDALAFGQVLKNNSKTLSVIVRHVHAGTMSASLEGNNDGLFAITQGASASSTNTEVATTIIVSYNPVESETEASATLVISSNNGLNTIRIPLSGSCPPQLTPVFTLEKTDIELDETVAFTFSDYTNPQVEIADESIVRYDAENHTLTGLALGATTVTLTQEETGEVLAGEQVFNVNVVKIAPRLAIVEGGYAKTLISIEPNNQTTISFSTRSDAEITFTQVSGEDYVSYNSETKVLKALNKGVAEFVASQPENERYTAAEVKVTVWVKSKYHLPIVVDESLYNDGNFKTNTSGDNAWKGDEGICIGGYNGWTDGVANWDDKYVEFHFEGIPDKLSFEFKYIYRDDLLNQMTATMPGSSTVEGEKYFLYIEESADGQKWTSINWQHTKPNKSAWQTSGDQQLKKTTRYLRFHLHANYGALYRHIQISELKYVEDPDPATIDLGTAAINYGEVKATSLINWCNVAPMSVVSSNDRFTVTPGTFGNYDEYDSQTLEISYTHGNIVGEQKADITISNGTYTKLIKVSANTTKRPQTIEWNKELSATGFAMNVGEQYPDEVITTIATTANGELITFASANDAIIEVVDDTILVAKAEGTVKIYAHQAGDEEYQEANDSVVFTVTNLLKQTITWEQNLFGLLTTSEPVELTATATSGGEITYESANSDVVTVEGNILTVKGEGETYITASQAGGEIDGHEYLPISMRNYVIVRNPKSQCNGWALSQNSLTLGSKLKRQIYDLSGIPQTLTFNAYHGDKSAVWGTGVSYAELVVEQYACLNGKWDWYTVFSKVVGTSDAFYQADDDLDESATKIRISTGETAVDHMISNIRVSRKKFMRANIEAIDLDVEANATWEQKITVSHSNIDLMTVTTKQGLLTLSTTTLGEGCGSYGDDAFVASFTPMQKYQEFKDTIVITDRKEEPSTIEIPVRLYSKGLNQSIDFDLPTTAKTTDEIFLSASASSELEVTFSTSNENIAYVGENNKLEIVTSGEVTVYAIQVGNEKYDTARVEKTILISKVAAPITTDPTASNLVYGQTLAESELSNGAATVDGTFAWEDGNIVPNAGNQTFKVIFTPENVAWYESSSVDVTVHVDKADAELVKAPTATDISFGQTLADAQLIGGEATFDGEFVWADPTIAPQSIGEFEYDVNFVPANPDNYNGFTITVKVTVNKQAPAITVLPTATEITYGQTLADSQLNGGEAETTGTFAWADPTIAPEAGTSEQYVIFTPDDTENFGKATLTVNVTVAKAESEVLSAPRAIQPLAYNGETQELILPGEAKGGTMVYSLDGQNFSEDLPTGIEIGEYTVYFRVVGDANHNDSEIDYITAAILDPSEVKLVQTITWNQELGNMPFNQSIQLEATCTSGDEVFFEIIVGNYEIAYINDFNVLFTYETEGMVKVRAYVEETDDYYYAELEKQFYVFDPTTTPVDQTAVQTKAQKIIRNNQLLIIRDGKTYNAAGLLVE